MQQHLERGHVEVVHKDDAALADRRAKDALAPLVELGVDDVLDLRRRQGDKRARKRPVALLMRETTDVPSTQRASLARGRQTHRLSRVCKRCREDGVAPCPDGAAAPQPRGLRRIKGARMDDNRKQAEEVEAS